MTSYYDCFVTWNRKTSTLDICARHPKTNVFYTRFIVFLFDQISESNVFSFYDYYKSNLKKFTTP